MAALPTDLRRDPWHGDDLSRCRRPTLGVANKTDRPVWILSRRPRARQGFPVFGYPVLSAARGRPGCADRRQAAVASRLRRTGLLCAPWPGMCLRPSALIAVTENKVNRGMGGGVFPKRTALCHARGRDRCIDLWDPRPSGMGGPGRGAGKRRKLGTTLPAGGFRRYEPATGTPTFAYGALQWHTWGSRFLEWTALDMSVWTRGKAPKRCRRHRIKATLR